MTALSVLDLMMIGEGKRFADTLDGARMLAQHVERHGYRRFWIAEHHNLPGIASSATTLLIQHVAQATSTLRVGAGGIMLPNHSPLVVAEQFGTLETLFPGRIDLGVGRAAGAAGQTVRALRGDACKRDFEQALKRVSDYLADNGRQPVRALPEEKRVPIVVLGSSVQSADLAARLGLPYAFASHFAPEYLMEAIARYRVAFRPSAALNQPYVIAGVNVIAAESRAEAEFLASSHRQWVNELHAGTPGPLPRPEEGYMERLEEFERRGLAQAMACSAIGSAGEVGAWLRQFIAVTQADELMIDARIYDPLARCRSYQLASEALVDGRVRVGDGKKPT